MNAAIVTWLVFRALRWLFWLGFFAYSIHFIAFRESHLNAYGHLLITTKLLMFGLAQAAIFAGFLELMKTRTHLLLDKDALPGLHNRYARI
jgi:Na+/phosphate symporter